MKNTIKIATLFAFAIIASTGFMMGMEIVEKQAKSKEEVKKETLQQWSNYIKNNSKKIAAEEYLYSEASHFLVSSIVEVDKDAASISEQTHEILTQLSNACKPKLTQLKRSIFDMILEDSSLNSTKKYQIIMALLLQHVMSTDENLNKKTFTPKMYQAWIQKAINARCTELFLCLLTKDFAAYMTETLFEDMIDTLLKNNGDQTGLKAVLYILKTIDSTFNEYEKKALNKSPDLEDMLTLTHFQMILGWLVAWLKSDSNISLVKKAISLRYWDYVDNCLDAVLEISKNSGFLLCILDNKELSQEEKEILIRHCIYRAHISKDKNCLTNILRYDNYKLLFTLCEQKQYHTVLHFIIRTYGEHNILLLLFSLNSKLPFNVVIKKMQLLLNSVDTQTRTKILNPHYVHNSLSALARCCNVHGGIEYFRFFLDTIGVNILESDNFLGRKGNSLALNACALPLLIATKGDKKLLDLNNRLIYVTDVIKRAKKQNVLEELLNKQGMTSPLWIAMMDKEDKLDAVANLLLKYGARYDTLDTKGHNILSFFLLNTFFDKTKRDVGLEKLFEHKDSIAPFFDQSYLYSPEQVLMLIAKLQKSKRNDVQACLYTLFTYLERDVYNAIRKKIVADYSNTQKKSAAYSTLVKIETSVENNVQEYSMLRQHNQRYYEGKNLQKLKSLQESFFRNKYAFKQPVREI